MITTFKFKFNVFYRVILYFGNQKFIKMISDSITCIFLVSNNNMTSETALRMVAYACTTGVDFDVQRRRYDVPAC